MTHWWYGSSPKRSRSPAHFIKGSFMKILTYGFALSVLLTVQALFAAPPFNLQSVRDGYRFQLNLSDPLLQKEAVYAVTKDGIRVDETFVKAYVSGFELEGAEGDPALLSSDIEFALSGNAPLVEVSDVVTQDISLGGKLYPMQPPRSYRDTAKPPFAYNPASYVPQNNILAKKSSAQHAIVTQFFTYRGQKSATVSIKPMSYDAATNTITVIKRMTVNLTMDKPDTLHSWNSMAFDRVMRTTYANLGYAAPESFSAKEKYLILAMPEYKDCAELKKFIDYRAQLYDVKVVSTADVGGTTIDAFRTFIRNEKPTFCLLVGNQPAFPSWNKSDWKSFNYYVATQVSSSSKKPQPDIALGLFYVTSAAQIVSIVNKTISTEESLSTRPKVALGQGGCNAPLDNLPANHCDKIIAEIMPKYFPSSDGWTVYAYATTTGADGAKKAVDQFNKGCWFNIYDGHGLTNGQEFGWGTKNLSSMTNTVYPFVLNCCCDIGDFYQNCAATASVANTYGPVTVIAANGTSYMGQHVLCQGYPEGIMNKKITKSGLAFVYAVNYDSVPKCYLSWSSPPSSMDKATMGWQFHHFGDPAIETMNSTAAAAYIDVTSPKKGDSIEQMSVCQVQWSSTITGNVKIDLYKGGKRVSTLSAATAAATGSFRWTPTSVDTVGSEYQIRVTSVDSSDLWDTSGTFGIRAEYLLTAPYFQSFDTLDSGSAFLPKGYTQSTDTSDSLDWIVWKGPTPSRRGSSPATGPQSDHTSGTGKYLYIEASGNGNTPNKKAEFTTPNFNLMSGSYSLSFWIHMFSSRNTMGAVSLDVCVDGVWKNDAIKVNGNQGDQWVEQKLNCSAYKGNRIGFRFRGVTGTDGASDICIDDFRIFQQSTSTAPLSTSAFPPSCDLAIAGSKILFKIPAPSASERVRISLYNSRGQFVRSLFEGKESAGEHCRSVGNLAKGLYILSMKIGNFQKTMDFVYAK
jgi:hypothetical protein